MKKFVKIFSLFLLIIFLFTLIFPSISHASSNAIVEAYNNTPESELGLANVLNIILISIGIVLILLGIAIFIRLKNV